MNREKKPFKETKFGKFVCNKLPDAAAAIGDLLPDKGVLGIVKNIIDKSTLSDSEKTELLNQAREFELTELKAYLEDVQDARKMQVAVLGQEDKFAKRFIYYLAAIYLILCFGFLFTIAFVRIPEGNEAIINVSVGALVVGGITTIVSFFFGSSKGSARKDEVIQDLVNQI